MKELQVKTVIFTRDINDIVKQPEVTNNPLEKIKKLVVKNKKFLILISPIFDPSRGGTEGPSIESIDIEDENQSFISLIKKDYLSD